MYGYGLPIQPLTPSSAMQHKLGLQPVTLYEPHTRASLLSPRSAPPEPPTPRLTSSRSGFFFTHFPVRFQKASSPVPSGYDVLSHPPEKFSLSGSATSTLLPTRDYGLRKTIAHVHRTQSAGGREKERCHLCCGQTGKGSSSQMLF